MRIVKYILISLLIVSIYKIQAQEDDFELLERWGYGPSYQIVFQDDYAFLNSGAVMITLDISDPMNPIEVSNTLIGKMILDFTIKDNLIYSLDADSMYISEVHPDGMVIPQNAILNPSGRAIEIYRNHLFILDSRKSMQIFDLETPEYPNLITSFNMDESASSIQFVGDYAFTAHRSDWIGIINISDLTELSFTKYVLPNESYIPSTFAVDDTLYIGSSDSLYIFQIDEMGKPGRLGSAWVKFINRMIVDNGFLYAAGQGHGAFIYDVSNPENIFLLSTINTPWDDVNKHGDIVFGFEQDAGIQMFDVSDAYAPKNIYHLPYGSSCYKMEYFDNKLYLASGNYGPRVLDIKNPEVLGYAFPLSLDPVFTTGFTLTFPYIYAAAGDYGFTIYKMNADGTFSIISTIVTGLLGQVLVKGNYAYIVSTWPTTGIYTADITDPMNPKIIDTFSTKKEISKLLLRDEFLYVSEIGVSLKVFDISNPLRMTLVDSINYPNHIRDMITHENYLYVAISRNVDIFDVSDPAHPILLENKIYTRSAQNLFITENQLYAARSSHGLSIFDISKPQNPTLITNYSNTYLAQDIYARNDTIFILDQLAGVYVLKYNPGTTAVQNNTRWHNSGFNIYPNPSNGYLWIKNTGNTNFEFIKEIQITDVSGSKIKTLNIDKNEFRGQDSYLLNCSDLVTGIYIISIKTNNKTFIQKVHLLN